MLVEITPGMVAVAIAFGVFVLAITYFAGRQSRSEREEEKISEAVTNYKIEAEKRNNETVERLQEDHDLQLEQNELYYMGELEKLVSNILGITFKPEDIEEGRFTKVREFSFPKVADSEKIVVIKPIDSSEDEYDEIPMRVRKENNVPSMFDLNEGIILPVKEEEGLKVPAV